MSTTDQHRRAGKQIAEWIEKTGPQRMSDIVAYTGRTLRYCEKIMTAASQAGYITHARFHGTRTLWCTHVTAVELREQRHEKRMAYANDLYRRRVAAGVITTANMLADPPDWQVEQRIIKAGTKPPPVTRAANSVFAWRPT